jgi:hypothetical protein
MASKAKKMQNMKFKPTEYQQLAIDIQQLEHQAMVLGLFATVHFLNKAQQECGGEIARIMEMLAKKKSSIALER